MCLKRIVSLSLVVASGAVFGEPVEFKGTLSVKGELTAPQGSKPKSPYLIFEENIYGAVADTQTKAQVNWEKECAAFKEYSEASGALRPTCGTPEIVPMTYSVCENNQQSPVEVSGFQARSVSRTLVRYGGSYEGVSERLEGKSFPIEKQSALTALENAHNSFVETCRDWRAELRETFGGELLWATCHHTTPGFGRNLVSKGDSCAKIQSAVEIAQERSNPNDPRFFMVMALQMSLPETQYYVTGTVPGWNQFKLGANASYWLKF